MSKKFRLLIVLALAISLALPTTALADTYVVKAGDSLSKIAQNYPGVTWQAICTANELANCALIYAGQVLTIPSAGTTATTASTGINDYEAEHWKRLRELKPVFEQKGWQAWFTAAELTWDSISADARQIEEETTPDSEIVPAGLQVNAVNLHVTWPNIVTTSEPNRITETADTRKYQPDPGNPSTLYTNVVANGEVTVWVDGQNWGQLWPSGQTPSSAPTDGCFTIAQLEANYGTIVTDAQGTDNGLLYDGDLLAGAVLRITPEKAEELEALGWTIQGTNPDIKSCWSPPECRPLTQ